MFEITLLRSASFVGMMMLCFNSSAQSYVTYNHDATKMNQITVQEIGVGGLTPAFYYDVFHNSYQKSAARKNKLGFRSLAGVSSYQQVDVADSIKAYLTQRAEIEALNVADRQIDIAWLAEGNKITDKLTAFEANINRIVGAGGSLADKSRWVEYCNMYKTAIKVTQDAYMPNAQRKRQYLAIYADISQQNETLVSFLVQLSNKSKTSSLLAARLDRRSNVAAHALAAQERWRDAGRRNTGGNTGEGDNDDSENIVER